MAPYPHRQYLQTTDTNSVMVNSYENVNSSVEEYRSGSLTQIYDFGISGATRPELKWSYPKEEIMNNPFTLGAKLIDGSGTGQQTLNNLCKVITIQSTNTGGNALYIVQFDVTVRRSNFIEIAPALGAAAFGEKNVTTDNYLPPHDSKERLEDGRKAEELANKKRKVENVKALTLPALDAH